jgi:cyanate permease
MHHSPTAGNAPADDPFRTAGRMTTALGVLRAALGWWGIFGSIAALVWLTTEVRSVRALRRAGKYPRLAAWEYPIGVALVILLWPWWYAQILRAARGKAA